jgi:hypothetical protein
MALAALMLSTLLARAPALAAPPTVGLAQPAANDCKPVLTPNASRGNPRYATAADVAAIPSANVGDYIIDGWNAGGTTIFIDDSIALGPGKKILIKGGNYYRIYLTIPRVVGSQASPVLITNYGGQVAARQLVIKGARFFKLTGRYDPANKTGAANFLGWETKQPYYQGQFGFDIRNSWQDTTNSSLAVGGDATDYEIEYTETGEGGFAGMVLKTDSGSVDMNNVSIHHNYIHDSGGEGIYLGSTQSDPQHQFRGLRIYDNLIARAGLNTLQVGQLADDVIIEHNVLILGAMNWKNPFGLYQDEAVQFGLRRGGTTFRKNIVIGGGKFLAIGFLSPKAGLALDANAPFVVESNLFLSNRSGSGVYLASRGDNVTPLALRGNYFGRLGGQYQKVYPGYSDTTAAAWSAESVAAPAMTATGNRYDSTIVPPFVQARAQARLNASNNTLATIPNPRFNNFMELPASFNYTTIELWNRVIGAESGFPATDTNKGQPIVYAAGDLVMYKGWLYRSKQNNNSDHQPQAASDAWWDLVTFASTGGPCLPDDVRLFADDFYAKQNIGLTSVIVPATFDKRAYLPLVRR